MIEVITIFFATKLHIGVVLGGTLFFIFLTHSRRIVFAYRALIALPVAFVLGRMASFLISSPRPFVVENIQPLIAHIPDNGFPSEHTLLTATIAALVYIEHKGLGIVLGLLALCVGFARVRAKVHHGIDIVGSVFIASLAVFIVFRLVSWLQHSHSNKIPMLPKE